MPLHDWTDRNGWEGMHIFWMTEIARALRAGLPPGYRAVIAGSADDDGPMILVVGEWGAVAAVELIRRGTRTDLPPASSTPGDTSTTCAAAFTCCSSMSTGAGSTSRSRNSSPRVWHKPFRPRRRLRW